MPAPLVTIGDSITQGFQSGSISKNDLSYPALIARAIGLTIGTDFKVPELRGPSRDINVAPVPPGQGGLLVNLEDVARIWQNTPNILGLADPLRDGEVGAYLLRVQHLWKYDNYSVPMTTGPLHHNLAVWGFEVGDADTLCEGLCTREIVRGLNSDSLVTNYAMYRTARFTLNPSLAPTMSSLTQIEAAQEISNQEGGIDHLIFFLGANNCLGCITHLDQPIKFSDDGDLYFLSQDRTATLWTPDLFETLYTRVAGKIAAIGAQNVYVGTVPHMHVPPVARGTWVDPNDQMANGLHAYYVPCWVSDDKFRAKPSNYTAFYTRDNMQMVNGVIDQYNATIRSIAAQHGWVVVDTCATLDQVHSGQFVFPQGLITSLTNNPNTAGRIVAGRPILTTDFFTYDPNGATPQDKYKGGFFGLDGIHPTTVGYGLVASVFLQAMGMGANVSQNWWDFVVASDTLFNDPPTSIQNMLDTVGELGATNLFEKVADVVGGSILPGL